MDKIDARTLTVEGREVLRRMVIRLRKQSGMPIKSLAQVAGIHYQTVRTWLFRACQEGEESLGEKKRGRPVGSCCKLTLAEEVWLREKIVDQTPQQMKLPFALWSRPAIKALVQERFGIQMRDRLIGKYLKRWGFTPQRPIKRALEQRSEEIAAWLKQTYPQVLARARAEGARIYWSDETAIREDANRVRGYAPHGQTPVSSTPTRWNKLSMISAISPRGEVAFQIVEGSLNAERFKQFLVDLIKEVSRKVYLVVDSLRVHHDKLIKEWLADKTEKIELVFLPPCAPQFNPDEYLNHHFKTALRSVPVSYNKDSLLKKAMTFMQALNTMPQMVRACFRHPSVAYAAQGI
ncbi:MAG: IS630 family transposase [Betaproteobacteria bacterium]|nr:IS630 family transposase [Betaproteobacteria bacterium]